MELFKVFCLKNKIFEKKNLQKNIIYVKSKLLNNELEV